MVEQKLNEAKNKFIQLCRTWINEYPSLQFTVKTQKLVQHDYYYYFIFSVLQKGHIHFYNL